MTRRALVPARVGLVGNPSDGHGGAVLAAIVDASAFARRFAGLDSRVAERREAWRLWSEGAGRAAVTVDLESADAARAEPYLQAALSSPVEPRP